VVTESEINNQLMLTVFSKSVVLRTKASFNISKVIAFKFNLLVSTVWLT